MMCESFVIKITVYGRRELHFFVVEFWYVSLIFNVEWVGFLCVSAQGFFKYCID